MDPLTHGLLGGIAAQVALGRRADLPLAGAGCLAAMAPDLDLLIHSSGDPILSWWLHRQFTHSLLFIPVGGLLVASILWFFYRRRYGFGRIYLAATVGFATHGLLDAFTSYGTLLYWPFSSERIFWDILPIVDPVFTLILLAGFLASLWRRSAIPALVALLCVGAYTALAHHQHQRGLQAQARLIQSRGHESQSGRVMPTVGNIILWRSLYRDASRIYADGLRLPFGGEEFFWEGDSVEKFQKGEVSQKISPGSALDRDLTRLQWFADDYLIWVDRDLGVIGDVRFSPRVSGLQPFWGIRANFSSPKQEVQKVRFGFSLREALGELWDRIWGNSPASRSVEAPTQFQRGPPKIQTVKPRS